MVGSVHAHPGLSVRGSSGRVGSCLLALGPHCPCCPRDGTGPLGPKAPLLPDPSWWSGPSVSSPACPLAEPVTLLSVCLSRSGAPVEEAAPRTGPPALRLGRVGGGLPSWGVAICEGLSPKCPQLVGCWPFHPLMTRLLTARDVRAGVPAGCFGLTGQSLVSC